MSSGWRFLGGIDFPGRCEDLSRRILRPLQITLFIRITLQQNDQFDYIEFRMIDHAD